MAQQFTALLVEEIEPKHYGRRIVTRSVDDLPPGELLVRVRYSSLNYKDALSATGNKGVTRRFPHTPGIDAAGEVVEDASGTFAPGEAVIVTGFDLGMNTAGGFGQYIRVPAAWAVRLPPGLDLRQAMIIGTAGFTAALCVWRLQQAGVNPTGGDVVVTGATGGVGSIAVSLLARAGYQPAAVTGKTDQADYLRHLGAVQILDRTEVTAGADKPLLQERWAGAIDVVGGEMLAAVLKSTRYGGAVACCGLVGSPELPVNVFPFILRGVSLLGIDSVQCPMPVRQLIWSRLGAEWQLPNLEETATECTLEQLEEPIQAILRGELRGRIVVRL
ncbi:MAG: YhdH/YhfP family quinone oxidoreductase [Desulfuromonadales bacterium]|nr:YhdH/YhfP family quinone oxidoreductase [Desulfuromonadales bacterium]